jgi:hypothetical protein
MDYKCDPVVESANEKDEYGILFAVMILIDFIIKFFNLFL